MAAAQTLERRIRVTLGSKLSIFLGLRACRIGVLCMQGIRGIFGWVASAPFGHSVLTSCQPRWLYWLLRAYGQCVDAVAVSAFTWF